MEQEDIVELAELTLSDSIGSFSLEKAGVEKMTLRGHGNRCEELPIHRGDLVPCGDLTDDQKRAKDCRLHLVMTTSLSSSRPSSWPWPMRCVCSRLTLAATSATLNLGCRIKP